MDANIRLTHSAIKVSCAVRPNERSPDNDIALARAEAASASKRIAITRSHAYRVRPYTTHGATVSHVVYSHDTKRMGKLAVVISPVNL